MNFYWSQNEDIALDGLTHRAQVLYLRVLRRRMDFATCITGIVVRLSYALMGEWLEELPEPKSRKPKTRPTIGEIRASLAQLERAGLIEPVLDQKNEKMPLVFFLPLAQMGLVRLKFEQQMNNRDERQEIEAMSGTGQNIGAMPLRPVKARGLANGGGVDNSGKRQRFNTMNDRQNDDLDTHEQQTSVSSLSSLSLNNNITTRARGNGYTISGDWFPSVSTIEKLGVDFGLPEKFISRKAFEFRLLWREQNIIAMNWDSYFYGACKNKIREQDGEFMTVLKSQWGGYERT